MLQCCQNNNEKFINNKSTRNSISWTQSVYLIDLSKNNIENLPLGTFRNLFKLQTLVLKENALTSLNPELFIDLFKLNHIDLSKNHLSNLSGIKFNYHMQYIDFSFNNINSETDIFSTMCAFEGVKFVNLSHNNLLKFEIG